MKLGWVHTLDDQRLGGKGGLSFLKSHGPWEGEKNTTLAHAEKPGGCQKKGEGPIANGSR